MTSEYEEYKCDVTDDITACFDSMQCQPILFIGSGVSRRYFGAPSWAEMLEYMAGQCPEIKRPFAYYLQSIGDLPEIGSKFAQQYMEWAWGDGRKHFPEALFAADVAPSSFLKHSIAEYIESITPKNIDDPRLSAHKEELAQLQKIHPHALITTNYDTFLETLFPQYEAVIGEKVLRSNYATIGEILKIHGCVTQPQTTVLTTNDYQAFIEKRKYLSAKLFAYFAEHPFLFVGYSASDENIKHIIADIDLLLSARNELIPNIYVLEWSSPIPESEYPTREKLIAIDATRSVRVKSIKANSFGWVFDAFSRRNAIEQVNPKLLRALLSRTYEMVRHDIPQKTIEVDYGTLEHAVEGMGNLARLLGIQTLSNASTINADFPYSLSQVGKKLGYRSWHQANQFLQQLKKEHKVDLKESDNRYHIAVRFGESPPNHKYSEALIDLLLKMKNGEPYSVTMR
jgi:hypothetical protein